MKPSINITTAEDVDDPPVGISVQDAGPGPAIIRKITWFVNKKPYDDVKEAMDLDGLPHVHSFEIEPGDTLAIGETEWLVKFLKNPREKKNDDDEMDQFTDKIDQTAVLVEFCPVIGTDCGKKCSRKGWCD